VTGVDCIDEVQSNLTLTPKRKRPAGQPCCVAPVAPEITPAEAIDVAAVARALADPIRVQLVDVLRRHAGEVCVCELQPLFDISQPTLSSHLRKLREAGIVGVERRGLWAYYYVLPDRLEALRSWLS
jgi:ArsR family transcriptional regulator, arsenate/arsenite/antimonite-responsive transcriptional repressor